MASKTAVAAVVSTHDTHASSLGPDLLFSCRTSPACTPRSASPRVRVPVLSCPFQRKITQGYLSETIAALQAFRKRHGDAQRIQAQFAAQPTTVDLAHYRSVLKNKAVVDEAEKIMREFKPVTYDASAHIKAIETFEAKAVSVVSLIIVPLEIVLMTALV